MSDQCAVRLVWRCTLCGEQISDGEGYAEVAFEAIAEAERRLRRKHVRLQHGGEWVDSGGWQEAPWRALHRRCDPSPESDSFWFPIEAIRSLDDLLDWNAHVIEKGYAESTNWVRWIQSVVEIAVSSEVVS